MRSAAKYMFGVALVLCVASMALAQPGGQRGGQRGGFGFGGGFGGFGGANRLALLRIEEVQKELGLTEDQIASINKLQEELRPMGRGGRGGGGEGQPRRRRGGDNNPDVRVNGPERFFVQAQGGRPQFSEEDRARFREEAAARAKKEREELAKILKPEQLKRLNEIYIQQAGVAALQDDEVAEQLKITDEQKEKFAKVREENQSAMRELFQDAGPDGDREAMRTKMTELRKQNEEKTLAVLTDAQKKQFEEMKGKKFDMPENAGRGGFGRGGNRGGNRPQN